MATTAMETIQLLKGFHRVLRTTLTKHKFIIILMREANASWGEERVTLCSFLNHAWHKENAERRIDYKGVGRVEESNRTMRQPRDKQKQETSTNFKI